MGALVGTAQLTARQVIVFGVDDELAAQRLVWGHDYTRQPDGATVVAEYQRSTDPRHC
jgi:hypothetical protein